MDSSQTLTIDQARQLLGRVGVEVPPNVPPQAVFQSLNRLLEGVPEGAVAAAVNAGTETRFGAQAGITFPPGLPVNYSANVAIEGRARLSDVETGGGLQNSQTFRASVQIQQDDRVAVERTLLNRIYGLSRYAEHLPDGMRGPLEQARERIDSNPALRTLARGFPVSFSHTESEGSRLTYEAQVSPELGRRLAAGDTTALPNPLEPLSMAPGSSVLVRGQDLRGSTTEAGYSFGLAGVSDTRLNGAGFGIRRLEGSEVEIYSGPMSAIETSAHLGLGRRNLASVRLETEGSLEERRLSVARVDLATPEGQTAYRQFLESGRVPDALAPGVTRVGQSHEVSIEQAQRLGLYAGNASIAFDNTTTQQITVGNLSGRDEVRFNYSRAGVVATESTYPLGADGRPDVAQGQFRVVLPNVGPNEAGAMRAAFGGPPGTRGLGDTQPVELNFDAGQLMALRERSRDYLAGRPGGTELLATIDAGRPLGIEMTDPLVRMAGARDAREVFGAMQDRPQDLPGALSRLNVGVDPAERRPLPGSLEIQPPASMRETLESRSDRARADLMDRFYRFPAGGAQTRAIDAVPGTAPTAPTADPQAATPAPASAAATSGAVTPPAVTATTGSTPPLASDSPAPPAPTPSGPAGAPAAATAPGIAAPAVAPLAQPAAAPAPDAISAPAIMHATPSAISIGSRPSPSNDDREERHERGRETGSARGPNGPPLTSSDHPDHALFSALRARAPADLSDEQVGRLTQHAKQADITPNRLEQVAIDRNDPNQAWVVGTIPGFRARVDLSQPAPSLEQTSAELLTRAPSRSQDPQEPAPTRAPLQQEAPHTLTR
jgi:hypothetical protein